MFHKILYNNIKSRVCVLAALCGCFLTAAYCPAQGQPNFPVPDGNPNQLFYLQRTPNANTVVYELNYINGNLDEAHPIHVFWIRYGEQGQKAELSSVQRNFAYGIKTVPVEKDVYEISFLSYRKYVMQLKKGVDNKYYVFTTVNGKPAILKKIYLEVDGGPFWSPNVKYAELTAVDPDTNKQVFERINIKS